MLLLSSLLTLAPTAQAACPTPWSPEALDERLAAAESTYTALDLEGFRRSVEEANLILPCLSAAVSPKLAARFHRVEGLRLFINADEVGAGAALSAARAVDPTYQFPDTMFDAAHAFRVKYEAAPTTDGKTEAVPTPRKGSIYLDGTIAKRRDIERAAIAQLVQETAVAESTVYLRPGDPLPAYPSRSPSQIPLFVASGAALIASGVFYGLAWSAHDAATDPTDTAMTNDDLTQLQADSTVFTYCSGGALIAGLGLAVGGVLPEFSAR